MMGSAETPSLAQRQADALALLAETAHHHLDPGAPGERYQVVVHVDAPVLADPEQPGQCVLEDGARVSYETGVWVRPPPSRAGPGSRAVRGGGRGGGGSVPCCAARRNRPRGPGGARGA